MAKVKKTPVVVVLGHVDHGKTSLLDRIRQTHLVDKEKGGITQSIGAWQVELKGKKITFIDTPGHAAFSQMRSRGAAVADVAVLVVAADDSVMPQTKEAIRIINQANIPFLVAVTKIDLPGADIEKVKADLARENVVVEAYGGQVVMVPLSNKTGQGIDELLEMILLTYEMQPVEVEVDKPAEGFVLETQFDKRRGKLVSLIISQGTLKQGDFISCGGKVAKIRAMYNDQGKAVKEAKPGEAVQVWGFEELPQVGEIFTSLGKTKVKKQRQKDNLIAGLDTQIRSELARLKDKKKVIPIFLKAQTKGALEAIVSSLPKEVKVVYQGVGEVTESEVELASTFGVEIVTFQLSPKQRIVNLAQAEGVKLTNYEIIYKLLEEFEKRVLKLLEPTIDQEILGKAKILKVFQIKEKQIAGCQVIEGKIEIKDKVELLRQEKIVGKSKIVSLRQGKELRQKVGKGDECGILLDPPLDFKPGDVICSYRE